MSVYEIEGTTESVRAKGEREDQAERERAREVLQCQSVPGFVTNQKEFRIPS